MDAALVRLLAYVVAGLLVVAGMFSCGYKVGDDHATVALTKTIDAQRADFQKRVDAATKAKDDAEAHAKSVEDMTTAELAKQAEGYEKEIEDEKAAAAVRVAQYRDGERRLRVAIASTVACRGAVPGSPGAGPVADGQATADLQPEVAGNLAQLAADADATVTKLSALQDYVGTVLKRFGHQETAQ